LNWLQFAGIKKIIQENYEKNRQELMYPAPTQAENGGQEMS